MIWLHIYMKLIIMKTFDNGLKKKKKLWFGKEMMIKKKKEKYFKSYNL